MMCGILTTLIEGHSLSFNTKESNFRSEDGYFWSSKGNFRFEKGQFCSEKDKNDDRIAFIVVYE